jgi:hypothetical protein
LARFSGLEAVAIARPAPQRWASWEARLPAPAMTTTDSPSAMCELVRSSCQAVAPWRTTACACASLTPSGTGPGEDVVRDDLLGGTTAVEQADHPWAAADRVPTSSAPGISGSCWAARWLFSISCVSASLIPAVDTS